MPAFEYEALDLTGRSKRGVVNADSARLARRELRRLSLTPLRISAPREKTSGVVARAENLRARSRAHDAPARRAPRRRNAA